MIIKINQLNILGVWPVHQQTVGEQCVVSGLSLLGMNP